MCEREYACVCERERQPRGPAAPQRRLALLCAACASRCPPSLLKHLCLPPAAPSAPPLPPALPRARRAVSRARCSWSPFSSSPSSRCTRTTTTTSSRTSSRCPCSCSSSSPCSTTARSSALRTTTSCPATSRRSGTSRCGRRPGRPLALFWLPRARDQRPLAAQPCSAYTACPGCAYARLLTRRLPLPLPRPSSPRR